MLYIQYSVRVGGNATFTSDPIKKGEIVKVLTGKIGKCRSRETIEIGPNEHIYDGYGAYMNHSSNPSVKIEGRNVVAIRDIKADEEINFDYRKNESAISYPFVDRETGEVID